jgi:CheY-like chemotaxis protein
MQVDISPLRFLIADDSPHMRRILGSVLHGFGIRTLYEARDGAEAFDLFVRHNPDVVVVDWVMPGMSGVESTRRIRVPGSKPNPYVPIIMITAYAERARVLQAREAGVTEFLCKPVSAKRLYERILNIVLNPRPFIQTKSFFGPDRRRHHEGSFPGLGRRKGEPGHAGGELRTEVVDLDEFEAASFGGPAPKRQAKSR